LTTYVEAVSPARLIPHDPAALNTLLRALLLERSLTDLNDALGHRPAWIGVGVESLEDVIAALPPEPDRRPAP
jgi:hypothetical protein